MRALELRRAAASNPAWIYQGRTLGEIEALAAVHLRECGLGGASTGL
jgi:hypothetical protein